MGEEESVTNWEVRMDIHTPPSERQTAWEAAVRRKELSSGLCEDLGGWGGGGDLCVFITDSRCCTVETNTALQTNYIPIKIVSATSAKKQ